MYLWLEYNGCIGKIDYVTPRGIIVRWLRTTDVFKKSKPERFFASGIHILAHEPRLTATLAARYINTSRTWIYALNQRGAFGGHKRHPFWVLPSELECFVDEQRHAA